MESFWNLPNALRKPKMKIMDHNMSVEIISAAKEATAELELDLTYNIIINTLASTYCWAISPFYQIYFIIISQVAKHFV